MPKKEDQVKAKTEKGEAIFQCLKNICTYAMKREFDSKVYALIKCTEGANTPFEHSHQFCVKYVEAFIGAYAHSQDPILIELLSMYLGTTDKFGTSSRVDRIKAFTEMYPECNEAWSPINVDESTARYRKNNLLVGMADLAAEKINKSHRLGLIDQIIAQQEENAPVDEEKSEDNCEPVNVAEAEPKPGRENRPKADAAGRFWQWVRNNTAPLVLITTVLFLLCAVPFCVSVSSDLSAIKNTVTQNNVTADDAPMVESISFLKGQDTMELIRGTSQEIGIDVCPDGADKYTVSTIPKDPSVATVRKLWVTATADWIEGAPHETVIEIQGGTSEPLYLPVCVRDKTKYESGTGLGVNDTAGGDQHE